MRVFVCVLAMAMKIAFLKTGFVIFNNFHHIARGMRIIAVRCYNQIKIFVLF